MRGCRRGLLTAADLDYFVCKDILEVLKSSEETNKKNWLGRYTSDHVKAWVNAIAQYESGNLYLAEASVLFIKNVQYEMWAGACGAPLTHAALICERQWRGRSIRSMTCIAERRMLSGSPRRTRPSLRRRAPTLGLRWRGRGSVADRVQGINLKDELLHRCSGLPQLFRKCADIVGWRRRGR